MELYKKYRPHKLKDVTGNTNTVIILESYLADNSLPHTLLFSGASGCGKTTLARILKDELGCPNSNFYEMNVADVRGIDNVREIRENIQYAPLNQQPIVYIIDEAHRLTTDAQNAFLKLLEDTPEYVYFFLATTDPDKLIKPIITRCTHLPVKPLNTQQMGYLLKQVLFLEKKHEEFTNDCVESIIEQAEGSPRLALVLLESYLNIPADKRDELQLNIHANHVDVIDLCKLLLKGNWADIQRCLSTLTEIDIEMARRVILGYMKSIVLRAKGDRCKEAAHIMSFFIDPFYNSGFPGFVLACYSTTI